MSKKQLFVIYGTLNQLKEFNRIVVSDCFEDDDRSQEWAKGFIAGFGLSFTCSPDDLFTPANYKADKREHYQDGHELGMRRGHQLQGIFMAGLEEAGIYQRVANTNKKQEKK
jgi:hypothetical protein